MAIRKDLTPDQRKQREMRRITKLYKNLDSSKKTLAEGLIERAAFMRIQCEDLEHDLSENGWTEPFSQGNQDPYDRARPQGQAYQTLNANYQKIIRQLDAMLPEESSRDAGDEAMNFVNGADST